MKKLLTLSFVIILAVTLISWGVIGHKTVATIAENHLTPQAKEVVSRFLVSESMADVASWADEVLRSPEYKHTASWHYLNLPLGLDYASFESAVKGQQKDNVYSALLKNEEIFTAATSTKEQRTDALKFIIHLVGDLHQPMHISREEDKGGNTIQVQFDGKGTNLHSLWDGKLIGKEGKSVEQMSIAYDNASKKQTKKWQRDSVTTWLWESYQISTKLYAEVESNNKLDDTYYQTHLPIVQQRIVMAGIRLAGLLNVLCKSLELKPDVYLYAELKPQPVKHIELTDLANNIGQMVTVQGLVSGTKDLSNMVLVNVGGDYPNQQLTVVLKGKARLRAASLANKSISVTGLVIEYKGQPEIMVTDEKNISLIEIVRDNKHRAPGGGS